MPRRDALATFSGIDLLTLAVTAKHQPRAGITFGVTNPACYCAKCLLHLCDSLVDATALLDNSLFVATPPDEERRVCQQCRKPTTLYT